MFLHSNHYEALKRPGVIGLATDTWYRYFGNHDTVDHLRGTMAHQMLFAAWEKGYRFAVVDGGSSVEFVSKIQEKGIQVFPQVQRGMSAGRQQGYQHLHEMGGIELFVRIEAEKVSFVRDDCVAIAGQPILRGTADLVVPARSAEGWASLPPDQADSEHAANAECCAMLRQWGLLKPADPDLDLFFGPRLFNRKAHPLFMQKHEWMRSTSIDWHALVQPGQYVDALFYPVAYALKQGLRVQSVPVPYLHPPEQTAYEMGKVDFQHKRDQQRSSIVAGFRALGELWGYVPTDRVRLRLMA